MKGRRILDQIYLAMEVVEYSEEELLNGAIIALDQMGHGPLDAVMAELASKDARLKETAWWIAIRHPEWGTALTGILKERLAGSLTDAEREEEMKRFVADLKKIAKIIT